MKGAAIAGFDWDDGNRAKWRKHGLSLDEVEAVFHHPHGLAPDIAHSGPEMRFLAIGDGGGSRPTLVAFTLRERDGARLIRPISARHMHRKEIEHYAQAIAQTGE